MCSLHYNLNFVFYLDHKELKLLNANVLPLSVVLCVFFGFVVVFCLFFVFVFVWGKQQYANVVSLYLRVMCNKLRPFGDQSLDLNCTSE